MVPTMRTLRAAVRLALPLSLLLASTAAAQSADHRQALLALHDSAQSASATELSALRATATYASSTDQELTRLRQAFLLLRQGELDSSSKTLRKAGEEFYNVTARHDDWPLAWYGIGLTERALARGKFPVLPARFHPLGADYNQGAIQAFVYALQKDSTFLPAAEGLAEAAQATTRWGYTGKARDALRRAAAHSAQTLLVRARLEREANDRERALSLLQRALQLGADSGVVYLELAREEFALDHDSLATVSYWNGVKFSSSPAAVQMLSEQLALIARPGELAGFDSLTTLGRLAMVRRFWTIREVDAGVEPGARLAEHYRRYELANKAFRPRNRGMTPVAPNVAARMAAVYGYGPTPTTAPNLDQVSYRTYSAGFVTSFYPFGPRLGDPIARQVREPWGWNDYSISSASPAYSERSLDYAYQATNSRIMAGSLLDEVDQSTSPLGSRGEAMMRYGEPEQAVGGVWMYTSQNGKLYVPVNGRMPGSLCDVFLRVCAAEARGYLKPEEYRALRKVLLDSHSDLARSDRMALPFNRQLTPAIDAYAMIDGGTGEGKIMVAFAIPGHQVEPQRMGDDFVYPVRIQLIAAPASGAYRVERDTVRYFRTDHRLVEGEYLQAVEQIPVPPENYHLRVVLQTADGERGSVGGDDSVVVNTVAKGVALGDLVLGRDGSGLSWWSGTDRLKLNPSGKVSRTEPLYLYYQLGGLPLGRAYQTSLEVFHATAPEKKPLITLSYDEVADRPVMEIQRVLDLQRLDAGVHTIRLTIRDAKGEVVAQRHASVRVE
jgi:hypothetical protein